MKNTFAETASLQSPLVDREAMKACFNDQSVIDFSKPDDCEMVQEMISEVCEQNYALRQLFAESRERGEIQR